MKFVTPYPPRYRDMGAAIFLAFGDEWERLDPPLPDDVSPGARWCVTLFQDDPDFNDESAIVRAVAECSRGPVLSRDFDSFAAPGHHVEVEVKLDRAHLLLVEDIEAEGLRVARVLAVSLAEAVAISKPVLP